MNKDIEIFEYQNGLFGLQDKRDHCVYNERFSTRKEAEDWLAKGGEPTELTDVFGNEEREHARKTNQQRRKLPSS